jgi:O-acetylserine/cysteine efflux transporter
VHPRHVLLAVAVTVVWGVNFLAIDAGVSEIPPTLFVAIRFVVVLIPAIFFVPRPRARWRDVLLLGTFMSLGQFALMYTGIALGMPPGLASLVLQAQAGLTVLFAVVALRETPTIMQVAGVLVGAVGLVVVGVGRSASTPVAGFVFVLAAAASWAIGNVIARRIARPGPARAQTPGLEPDSAAQRAGRAAALETAEKRSLQGHIQHLLPHLRRSAKRTSARDTVGACFSTRSLAGLSMTVWSALVVPIPMAALAIVLDGPHAVGSALAHMSWTAIGSTVYTAWLASLFGYGVWNTLLARYRAPAVVPFTMLVPVVGILAAWLAHGERPSAAELAGGAVLLLGVAITLGLGQGIAARIPRRAR